jgi:acetyl-CoA synthetase
MAAQVCDAWAACAPDQVALKTPEGEVTYRQLQELSDQLAGYLAKLGVRAGDRVGVFFAQSVWTAASHIAAWKLGAISLPLFTLFERDALLSRLSDAEASVVVTDKAGLAKIEALQTDLPTLLHVIDAAACSKTGRGFSAVDTGPEDPAVLIYTSGTTGKPKGALHGHRVLNGHLPGVELSHNFLGAPGDCLWTPADWAWIGGLFDVLMPGLALGVPVVASRFDKFSGAAAADVMRDFDIRNVFFPPTALRVLKAENVSISGLRSVASGGEPLGSEMLTWGKDAFGLTINEFYGQTECNMTVSSCSDLFEITPGFMGRPVPGHQVEVIDSDGHPTIGEGEVAVHRSSGSMMLGYWKNPEATAEKFIGAWMRTGDRGVKDGQDIRFVGRDDDVITSAGYRIGPAEIEDCLLQHPAVATVGVVGKPDDIRTEIVKAYVVPKPSIPPSEDLAEDLKAHVRTRLAQHCYPREIGFLEALPMTVTGKVIRNELRKRAAEELV